MDISKIKQLVKQSGDKFIVVENGEPELVVMSFDEYRRLSENHIDSWNDVAVTHRPVVSSEQPYQDSSDDFFQPREASDDALMEETDMGTEFDTDSGSISTTRDYIRSESAGLPVRLEDIRLEDLPI
jgi:prevent-host-death family protein